ncbi:hypothetical protein MBANPS3_012433 [Mucor bainieri]
MRQEKRKQKEVFEHDTSVNRLASFKSAKRKAESIAESSQSKNQKLDINVVIEALNKQFRRYVLQQLATSSNHTETLKLLASLSKMPRVVINAEDDIGAKRGEITSFLRNQPEPNVNLFRHYLRQNKELILKKEVEESKAASAGPSTTASRAASIIPRILASTSAPMFVNETEDFRTCTASFASILRTDMQEDARKHVVATLEKTLTATRDYTVDFSVLVTKMLLLFSDHTFQLSSNSVSFLSQGKILGGVFKIRQKVEFLELELS